MLEEIQIEISTNEDFYGAFLTEDWGLQFLAYRDCKIFNSGIVDIINFALSNLTLRTCEIYTAEAGQIKRAHVITPLRRQVEAEQEKKPAICLFFYRRHYDPLLKINLVNEKSYLL